MECKPARLGGMKQVVSLSPWPARGAEKSRVTRAALTNSRVRTLWISGGSQEVGFGLAKIRVVLCP